MKKPLAVLSTVLVLALGAAVLRAQTDTPKSEPTPPPRKHTFAIIYTHGKSWIAGKSIFEQPIEPHIEYMKKLSAEGTLRYGGPFTDDTGGLAIIQALTLEDAQKVLAADPAVKEGIMVGALHDWYQAFTPASKDAPPPVAP